jgi:hypothetical protein
MVIYFTNNPLKIYDYRIISSLHPASRRYGVEGLFTATIMHNNIIYEAVLYENKLIAVYKDNLWYAALDMQRANKYKEIDGIHYC